MNYPLIFLLAAALLPAAEPYRDWTVYGGGSDSIRYSALDQINRTNVTHLQIAWTYDTGDVFKESEMECNPIVVNGLLYATTPKLRLIALDAATGELRWSFDPGRHQETYGKARNRGVTYWSAGDDRRIFFAASHWLYALDARTGALVKTFGEDGRVDLRQGLGRPPEEMSISATSPGIVYKDLLIMGSIVSETLPASPGDIRAYDTRTGKIRWTFHTIPRPGEFGYDTWPLLTASTITTNSAPAPASASGISKPSITIFGIATSPPRPTWSPFSTTAERSMPSPRSPSPAMCSCSIARLASRYFRLRSGPSPHPKSRAKPLPPSKPCR